MKRIADTLWNIFERHPWLSMTAVVIAQTWFTLNNRALWFSDEVRYANAYQNLVQHGKWLVLSLNGQPYPDKPPVYFWFLWLIDKLTPADMPTVFFIGSALSGLLFLFAAHALARALKFSRSVCAGSSLVLLSTFFLTALFHYSRMDLLFAACIILAHACFYKAFTNDRQGRWPVIAFALCGLGTLIKGPLAIIFPLLTSGLFLAWKGQFKKLFTRPMLLGLLAMLGMILLWIAGVMIAEGPSFLLDTVLGKHVIQRATNTFHHKESLAYYFIAFPLAWLPWTLFAGALNFRPMGTADFWTGLFADRKYAGPNTFLWIMFLSGFAFLSSLSGKVLVYILPLFPPLAILTALALTELPAKRATRWWTLAAGLFCLLGAGLLLGGDFLPFPVPVRGLGIAAALLITLGVGFFLLRRSGHKTGLIFAALALTVWLYPVGSLVAPSLDNAMSPKLTGQTMKRYIDDGHTPFAYKIYSGIFTYYAGSDIAESSDLNHIAARIRGLDRAILVIREKHWTPWKNRPEGLLPVLRQEISGQSYILAVKN